MLALKILLCIVFGYFVGCINPAYIIGRLRGIDVRKSGSGNAGASNALILMGKAVGIFSALFDIFKAAGVMWLVPVIFGELPYGPEIAGVACALGHMYPVFMRFKGGKGLACLGGIIIAVDWRLFLIIITLAIIMVLVVDYICVVPITASIAMPLLYGFFGVDGLDWLKRAEGGWAGAAILGILTLVMLYKHIQNIRRIFRGTEVHFSFAWSKNKEQELAKVQANEVAWREKQAAKKAMREAKKNQ